MTIGHAKVLFFWSGAKISTRFTARLMSQEGARVRRQPARRTISIELENEDFVWQFRLRTYSTAGMHCDRGRGALSRDSPENAYRDGGNVPADRFERLQDSDDTPDAGLVCNEDSGRKTHGLGQGIAESWHIHPKDGWGASGSWSAFGDPFLAPCIPLALWLCGNMLLAEDGGSQENSISTRRRSDPVANGQASRAGIQFAVMNLFSCFGRIFF